MPSWLRRGPASKKDQAVTSEKASEHEAGSVREVRLRQEVNELQERRQEEGARLELARTELFTVETEEKKQEEELEAWNQRNAVLRGELAEAQSEAQAARELRSRTLVEEQVAQHRAEHAEVEKLELEELQARLSKLREEHARMRDEAALSAAETAASPLRQRAVELEELGAHHSRLAGAVKQCEVQNQERHVELREMREDYDARLEHGSREAQKLAAIQEQNARLSEDLPQVMLEVRRLQERYWETVPFRGIDAAELELMWRRKRESDNDVATLEKELSEEKRAADEAAAELALARRQLQKMNSASARHAQSGARLQEQQHQPPQAVSREVQVLDQSQVAAQAPRLEDTSRQGEAWTAAGGASMGCLQSEQASGLNRSVASSPATVANRRSLSSPLLTQTSAHEQGSPSRHRGTATESVSMDLHAKLNAALRTAARAQEKAQLQATNASLRSEIAAMRERAEQRRLREEIAFLESRRATRREHMPKEPSAEGLPSSTLSVHRQQCQLLLPPPSQLHSSSSGGPASQQPAWQEHAW